MGTEQERTGGSCGIPKEAEDALQDALSLIILLENDMEAQNADSVYLRVVKLEHDALKRMKKSLSAFWQAEGKEKQEPDVRQPD